MNDQNEIIDTLKYKMEEEGFEYCFRGYSDWKELKDEKFHKLREEYLFAAGKLQEYVENLEFNE